MSEKKISNLSGIFIFFIAFIIYYLTIEPTASYWDCSEFITCAYRLDVGHAPGAPVFMLLGRFFSFFAGTDPGRVAFMINLLSATASAAIIMFLFWIISWFGAKLITKSSKEYSSKEKLIIIYGSAAVGALSLAFSDSFWFSAVEGEVYACSSFFSALVFWAILRWEQSPAGWQCDRWILLIFYLLGLSVGIHLLNLLTLPAMALIFYYKNYKSTAKGIILTIVVSFIIICTCIFGLIPGIASFAAYFDLFFVNSLSLPVYTGAISFIIMLSGIFYYLYKYAIKTKKMLLKTITLAFSLWVIGYSSFIILVIRSNSNPFIDINNVENIFGLVNYLNREQYPQRPLIYGNNYNSPIVDAKNRYTYKLYNGKYLKDELNPEYIYDDKTLTFFPRMASAEGGHVEAYKNWVNIEGHEVTVQDQNGNLKKIKVPTFGDNFSFFLRYQLGYMYFRYFMWNFSGRQNDIQGHGGNLNGNWITGIPIIDQMLVGKQNLEIISPNALKSRNNYYMLPFILGLIGLFYQYQKDRNNFMSNLMLFIFTGVAIVVYLNEIPITPRERDYAFVGSFFAFTIWIGLGCQAIYDYLKGKRVNSSVAFAIVSISLVIVPLNMLKENFDDHDRSNRFTARDYAKNMLESCDKNAMLFTSADNDTYPVWYVQEVEGFRTDIREILEPFLPIDWYANQLNQQFDKKGKIDFSYKGEELLMSKNQYFPVIEKIDSAIDLSQLIEFVRNPDPRAQVESHDGSRMNFIPGKKLILRVNKVNFLKSCSYASIDSSLIPNQINFEINKQYLTRDELFILNILSKNEWKRPIHFVSPELLKQVGLSEYTYREGILYRFMPFKKELPVEFNRQLTMNQYQLFKNKFKWGNVNSNKVYIDYINIQMIAIFQYRQVFADLAKQLVAINEKQKAIEILDLGMKLFPLTKIPLTYQITGLIEGYYQANENMKASALSNEVTSSINKTLGFYASIADERTKYSAINEIRIDMYILQELNQISSKYSPGNQLNVEEIFQKYYKEFENMVKQ